MYRIYIYTKYIYIYIQNIYIYIERDLWLHSRSWKGFLPIKCRIWQLPPMKWPYRKVTTLSTHFLVVPSGYESVHLKLSNVGKTKINHPFGNGWNPTYKNGDWGMVGLWHCFTHMKNSIVWRIKNITGWWYTYPLKNTNVRLGWWHSQYMDSHKIPWFQSTNQNMFNID